MLNYDEFLTFLLLYAAHTDIDYSVEEQVLIKSILPSVSYDRVYDKFDSMTDFAALQLILEHRETHFATEPEKQVILDLVKALFHIDGDFSTMEHDLFLFLEKLL